MSAPVGYTCPSIDKIIGKIKDADSLLNAAVGYIESIIPEDDDVEYYKKKALQSLSDIDVYFEDELEALRRANDELRKWGEEMERKANDLEKEVCSLEGEISDLQSQI